MDINQQIKELVIDVIKDNHLSYNLTQEEKNNLKDEIVGQLKIEVNGKEFITKQQLSASLTEHYSQIHLLISTKVQEILDNTARKMDEKIRAIPQSNNGTTKLEIHHYRKNEKDESKIELEIEKLTSQQHKDFPTLLQLMNLNCNIYVFGPTGTGKTKSAFLIAKNILKCPVQSITLGPQTPASKIKGYMDAHGRYVAGAAYEVYKNGGLLIINEIDNGNAAINVELNELCDDECFFPCGQTVKHPKFFMLATANTVGNGANRSYIGRSPQDKALLNRFVFLEWPYDFNLEKQLGWKAYQEYGGSSVEEYTKALHDFWKMRKASEELKLDVIYSSRNLIDQLARMVATKVPTSTITKTVFCRGMEADQYRKITSEAGKLNISSFVKGETGEDNNGDKDNIKLIEAPTSYKEENKNNPISKIKETAYTKASTK